jgi:hypothetical protein
LSDPKPGPTQQALAAWQQWLSEQQSALRQRAEAERKRRAAMTPEQRAAEAEAIARQERRKIFQRFTKMGPTVLSRESWSIAQFSWLLVAENPLERGGFFDSEWDPAAASQKKFVAVLESCVGISLKPVNPTVSPAGQRFRTEELVRLSCRKKLGHAALLQALLGNKKAPYYFPALDVTASPTQLSARPKKAGPPTWHGIVAQVCREISEAAQNGQLESFSPTELPWSPQTLHQLAAKRHHEANLGPLPIKPDTLRKHLNRAHGWKAKSGYQDPVAVKRLRAVFKF